MLFLIWASLFSCLSLTFFERITYLHKLHLRKKFLIFFSSNLPPLSLSLLQLGHLLSLLYLVLLSSIPLNILVVYSFNVLEEWVVTTFPYPIMEKEKLVSSGTSHFLLILLTSRQNWALQLCIAIPMQAIRRIRSVRPCIAAFTNGGAL